MGKVYSDEELEKYGKNPKVEYICRNKLALTLDFKRELYNAWIKNPGAATIRRLLAANGFDVHSIGRDFYKNLAKAFKTYGEPKGIKPPAFNAADIVYGVSHDERGKTEPFPLEDKIAGIRKKLIGTGKFVPAEGDIWFSPDFERELFSAYPETSVRQGIKNAGLDLEEVGYPVIIRLEEKFRKVLEAAAHSFPDNKAEREIIRTPQETAELQANPFVEEASENEIKLGGNFYSAAFSIRSLPLDEVLEVFFIGHSALSESERTKIEKDLLRAAGSPVENAFCGGTILELCVLYRRAAALEKLVRKGYEEIADRLPSMSHLQKKRLCQWVNELPKDPSHKYTKAEILRQIGISRSVYYRYVKEADFGLGEIRKAEADRQDAETIRRVFEYKGFLKGSRLIYMLLPRLTGQRMSLRKIRRLMKLYGMDSGIRRPNEARRQAREQMEKTVSPNLLKRTFRLHRPNEVRVTDVTCLDYGNGKRAYGSALMDPVTGRLLAFVVSGNNDLEMALETLRMADGHPCEDGGIFHSDQGVLYRTGAFRKEILDRGLTQSMSKKGNCWDNATQESFFGHFKDECRYSSCENLQELKKRVAEYAVYYDNERGMWDRGRKTPVEYETYLLSLSGEEFGKYLAREEAKYHEMKERAARLAKKRYGTLGV